MQKKWWKPLISTFVLLFIALYVKSSFKEASVRKSENSSEIFDKVREDFQKLKDIKTKIIELKTNSQNDKDIISQNEQSLITIKEKLFKQIEVLKDNKNGYADLGKLYEVLAFYTLSETDLFNKSIVNLDVNNFQNKTGMQRLVAELALYIQAKQLSELQTNDGDIKKVDSLNNLKKLSTEGIYLNSLATIAYTKISNDKAENTNLVEKLISKFPEQSDIVK